MWIRIVKGNLSEKDGIEQSFKMVRDLAKNVSGEK